MDKKIKAIETKYKGYKFRSRLEARWAVFFDALGVEWDYEPEGYDLGSAGWYLPDFYLPESNIWVEVKPKPLNEKEREKAFFLCSLTGDPVIHLGAIPDPDKVKGVGVFCDVNHYVGADIKGYSQEFFASDLIDFYLEKTEINSTASSDGILRDALKWDIEYYKERYSKDHPLHFENGMIIKYESFNFGSRLELACQKARSARFEHGETP